MNKLNKLQPPKGLKPGQEKFPQSVLDWIAQENLWNLWVPKSYGGLELSLSEGLTKLKALARMDGSLGWTVTLCSGANYFIGNLNPITTATIFKNSSHKVCFGGSGAVGGIANRQGEHYEISGKWAYATGAPYLTHFTLNATLYENGSPVYTKEGNPEVRSFVVAKSAVKIIEDWQSMGLKATATHSFQIEKALVHQNDSFVYNHCYLPYPIFKIPFEVFANLTLWVNYIAMAEHFMEAGKHLKTGGLWDTMEQQLEKINKKVTKYVAEVEKQLEAQQNFSSQIIEEIHAQASHAVKTLTQSLISIYPYLGVKASHTDQEVHQVFCDYFTATQHHIFTKR